LSISTPHAAWRETGIVIDSHTHVDAPYVDLAVRIMDAADLHMMVEISGDSYGERLTARLAAMARYPGRFAAYAGVDWQGFGSPNWAVAAGDALARAVEAGAVGLKLDKALATLMVAWWRWTMSV